jgi:glucose-1-phosphate thymidylyltransferase
MEALLAAGIRKIGIVVGDTRAEIQAVVGDGAEWRERWGEDVHITYIAQAEPLGLAHAVKISQPFLGADRFVMYLGDNLVGQSLKSLVDAFDAPKRHYACHILLTEVKNPSQFGVAEIEHDSAAPVVETAELAGIRTQATTLGIAIDQGQVSLSPPIRLTDENPGTAPAPVRVKRLIEKPKTPPSNLALVGIYFFDKTIFTAVDHIQPSARGELEITDAIQWLIDHQYEVRANLLSGYWIDTGKMEDILDANRQVLLDLPPTLDPSARVSPNSSLSGAVTLQRGAVIENSVIRGPAIIGERTVIRNSYIGPFTSIYHDALIEDSEVEYSIVLEHSVVTGVDGRIQESLIGRYAEVRTADPKPRGHKLMLGDHSRVGVLRAGS